jgi:hypothetical protein
MNGIAPSLPRGSSCRYHAIRTVFPEHIAVVDVLRRGPPRRNELRGHAVLHRQSTYRRGDLFDKRRKLVEAWAVYCAAPKTGKIVSLTR